MTAPSALFGAIEAGGTKFVCGIGTAAGSRATTTIPTRDPDTTFADVAAFFAEASAAGSLAAIGVASFGPIRIDPGAPDYGAILRTPKPGWEGANMVTRAAAIADVPIALDTDVNAAAVAEARAARIDDLCYVTIGTGIGAGIVTAGRTVHGATHPEFGHLLVRRHPDHGAFAGVCPFHGDCLEGLASGPAMVAAWNTPGVDLPSDHPGWTIEADYLAQACVSLILTVSPKRVVLGGGVMQQASLFPLIRSRVLELLGGYAVDVAADTIGMITSPVSIEPPGLVGAYLLAEQARAAANS